MQELPTAPTSSPALRLVAAAVSVLAVAVACGGGGAEPALEVVVTGEPEVVFDWSEEACEDADAPDGPARAFRDEGGGVHLVTPQHVNRSALGPALSSVAHSCRVVYRGAMQDDPRRFDDRAWVMSPYTLDGRTVHALVHNEYHGHRRADRCPSRDYQSCWENSVTYARSDDGGGTFRLADGADRLVAGPSAPYRGDRGRPIGVFNPSNVLAHEGAYYVFVYVRVEAGDHVCLLRTEAIDDPGSWRAWDGRSFDGPADDTCPPVGAGVFFASVSSVVRHELSGTFVALMAGTATSSSGDGPGSARSGVFYATSRDLVHWSDRALAWATPAWGNVDCSTPSSIGYPALLDETSTSRNFETAGDAPFLYATRFNLEGCAIGADRDLIRVPVRISTAGSGGPSSP